jgi:MFS superfamily sulfate permease-like transporter
LVCVVTIPHIINMVPLAVLAGVLLMIGYKLAKPEVFKQMYQLGWSQFLPFMATIIGVVFTDLLIGVGLGMVVAVIILLRNSYKNSHFLHREQQDDGSKKVKMTLAEEVVFLNKGTIKKELSRIKEGTILTIDMSKSVTIDHDVLEIIEDFTKEAETKNIEVELLTRNNGKTKQVKHITETEELEYSK